VAHAHDDRRGDAPLQTGRQGRWAAAVRPPDVPARQARHPRQPDAIAGPPGPPLAFPPCPDDDAGWAAVLAASPALEPALTGVADGLAAGLDGHRVRACGNGVVPAVAALAWRTLTAALTEAESIPVLGGQPADRPAL
jgi:hypothetical protein